METCSLSFAALLIRGEMQKQLGGFDEGLDGAEWCLRDFIRRSEASGYHTCVIHTPNWPAARKPSSDRRNAARNSPASVVTDF